MQHSVVSSSVSASSTTTLPWVEKYRPTSLQHIVHHDAIVKLLRVFIVSRESPHLFFYGPPGTGKTSTILSCAREIYGKSVTTMVLHLNASDERGLDVVRKQIIQFASTANFFCVDKTLCKLVVLDEADSMTSAAQMALRDIMMTYDTLFCLIGNYQYALLPPLQSRVVRLLFTPIPQADAIALGEQVLLAEGYDCASPDVLVPVYEQTGGDMRQFLNVLQAIAMRGDTQKTSTSDNAVINPFTTEHVRAVLCQWDVSHVADYVNKVLLKKSLQVCYKHLHTSIVDMHTHTLGTWLHALQEYLLAYDAKTVAQYDGNEDSVVSDVAALQRTLYFCTELATIEYNASVALYPDVQLFALVACCYQFVRRKA